MANEYTATVAPYPTKEEQVTADALARHIACQIQRDITSTQEHYYMRAPVGDKQAARDFGLLCSRMTGYYGALVALRALAEHAPDRADEVARRLWNDWQDGSSIGEWVWEWLTGYGIDPSRVSAEAPPVERITVEAVAR